MPVRLNGSTSGYTELSAPAVAGNNSIALPTGNGSAYQILRNGATAGSLEYVDNLVLGTAQNSTSGTSIDFTGIPSWVKRITVMFNGVSLSGSSQPRVQLGTSSGPLTSGYSGTSQGSSSSLLSGGFDIGSGYANAANIWNGNFIITNLSAGTWTATAILGGSNTTFLAYMSGVVTLSGTLDRVRITTASGTDTFDAGSINIMYE